MDTIPVNPKLIDTTEPEVRGRVLIVDDDADIGELLQIQLSRRGFEADWAGSSEEALEKLGTADVDVIVTDLKLRGMDGVELCRRVTTNRPDIPVIVITGYGSMQTVIAAMRAGAYDFITKPVEPDGLDLSLRRAVQHRALREEVNHLRQVVAESKRFGDIVGESPAMKRLYGMLERVADAEATVLVGGETGTGKELVARMLHERSNRAEGPFVALNCSAVPRTLMESELFGHVKGAFTDARNDRKGLFLQASGGTILLDEIGEMPLELQPKLLRALEEGRVRPVGSDREVPFDARVIAATHVDLEDAVEEGRFREDLFFRINVIQLELPPLRERGNDILLLAQTFIERASERSGRPVTGLTPAAARKLLAYGWPGNVRELQNCIDRAVALTRSSEIGLDDLPGRVQAAQGPGASPAEPSGGFLPMVEVERRYIAKVLDTLGGNKAKAARVLGFDRKTLYRKLERYGIDADGRRS